MTQQRVSPISVTSVLPAVPVLSLQAALGQSANLTEWKNSSGTVLASVTSSADILANSFQTQRFIRDVAATTPFLDFSSNKFIVNARNASYIALTVDGVASQTADLQQWRNSAGTVLARVDAGGAMRLDTSSTNTSQFNVAGQIRLYNTSNTNNNYTVIENYANGAITSGIAFQNTDWTNNYGRLVIGTRSAAGFNSNAFIVPSGGGFFTSTNTAASVVATVRGAASQTANLQEWQNSAGTVLASVGADGSFAFPGSASINTAGRFKGDSVIVNYSQANSATGAYIDYSIANAASITIIGRTTTTAPNLIIKQMASQTGDMQQWQNSSATVLGKFDATGNMVVGNMAIAASSVATIHISNGTIPSANPTGGGVLYVEAGALKYRGSSGTVTTIANA